MPTTHPPCDAPTSSFDAIPRLTTWQRSRLVRSTRKLTKILGETPVPQMTLPSHGSLPQRNKSREVIQEYPRHPIVGRTKQLARTALEPIQAALRRETDRDSVGARSTNSESVCASTPLCGRDQSPVLLFEAPTHSPVNSRACYVSSNSNSSSPVEPGPSLRRRRSSLASLSSSHLINSPTEREECEEEREARSRRRRLSKLTRHLGESIPPELISSNITSSKPKSNANTSTFIPPVVPYPSTAHTVLPPLEQGKPFSPTTHSTPKFPKRAVARKVDSLVGSIGRSLSQRFSSEVTSPRLLAQRLRRSRSESSLSLSHEHITLLRPDTYVAAGDHLDTPIDGVLGQQSFRAIPESPSPAASTFPDFDAISHPRKHG